jgi:hypothetical protein
MHDAGSAPVVLESDRLGVGGGEYAHVDVPQIVTPNRLRGTEDYPPIGANVTAKVLGYSGNQLRLTLREE